MREEAGCEYVASVNEVKQKNDNQCIPSIFHIIPLDARLKFIHFSLSSLLSLITPCQVWNIRTGQCLRKFERAHAGGVTCVLFTRDGTQVLSGSFDFSVRYVARSYCFLLEYSTLTHTCSHSITHTISHSHTTNYVTLITHS